LANAAPSLGRPKDSTSGVGQSRSLNPVESALLQAFRETDTRGKRILLAIAETLIPGMIPPSALQTREKDPFMGDR
jgi:hypothetical protein